MTDDTHDKGFVERVKETASEIFSTGPEGERDGNSLIDDGCQVGSGFGTFGTGTWPGTGSATKRGNGAAETPSSETDE